MIKRLYEYENGGLDLEETVELFQDLHSTGMLYTLGNDYNKVFYNLVDEGYIKLGEDYG